MEELRQRITARTTKVKRYGNKLKQFQDNRNFLDLPRKIF